ncbi:MAG: hypothetical protein CVT88_04930 [Candidatus Altiarchaeales archaeon HGW-Altiarchaeales-1]|nr:MAG: hypothetical protein CVT88_04930 [Candidatus Altiarchaeales archaeon HGW-Altiarchaeales-1]
MQNLLKTLSFQSLKILRIFKLPVKISKNTNFKKVIFEILFENTQTESAHSRSWIFQKLRF